MPAVAGQQRKLLELLRRTRCHCQIDATGLGHLGNLLGGSLQQVELHLGITLAELLDHRRQHIARLRVRGADRQRTRAVVLVVGGDALDVLHFAQHAQRALDHALARRGDLRQRAAVAHEDLEPELILELPQLLADRRLRRIAASPPP